MRIRLGEFVVITSVCSGPYGLASPTAVRRYLDIRGFQIAMNDALFVCGFECFADTLGDLQCFINRDRTSFNTLR
jgi:hypothetical protein